MTKHERYAARFVALCFAVAIASLISAHLSFVFLAPLIMFYCSLLANTYVSIACFRSVVSPSDQGQKIVNGFLAVIYLGLSVSFFQPLVFVLLTTGLFFLACIKYALLIGRTREVALIRRKIVIDVLGAVWCTLAFVGLSLWSRDEIRILWVWAAVFAVANLYFLFVRPMYRLSTSEDEKGILA